jgi:ABC-2 type transport system ATP-binding protein
MVNRAPGTAVDAHELSRRFGTRLALDRVSLEVEGGEVHALLGPNGAGKTTLMRIVAGLLEPTSGSVRVAGIASSGSPRALRRVLGLVPSGDRSFYLRISGLENLVFFARLHGMRRAAAKARACVVLEQVGLDATSRLPVALYSHGMQKRLSVARALLTEPRVLLLDEATHDLDPQGAHAVRRLARDATRAGTAVLWATQRVEEIRAFADRVTVLADGRVRFLGTVAQLSERARPRRYVVQLRNGSLTGESLERMLNSRLSGLAALASADASSSDYYVLSLADGVVLGDALASLIAADVQVLACRDERPEIEDAFLALTEDQT